MDRNRLTEELEKTTYQWAAGAEILKSALEMLRSPHELCLRAPDQVRRLMSQTFYDRFFLDEYGTVTHAVLKPAIR